MKPWRLDIRILHDARTRSSLSRILRASLLGCGPEVWEALKTQWRLHCSVAGRALRRRTSEEVADTATKLRIALRVDRLTPLMRAWQRELRGRFQRLIAASSLTAAAWRCRRNPCAHPEVLRFAKSSLLNPSSRLGTPAARFLHTALPPTRDQSVFLDHFANVACTTMSSHRDTTETAAMLSRLPQISSEVAE